MTTDTLDNCPRCGARLFGAYSRTDVSDYHKVCFACGFETYDTIENKADHGRRMLARETDARVRHPDSPPRQDYPPGADGYRAWKRLYSQWYTGMVRARNIAFHLEETQPQLFPSPRRPRP